MNYKIVISSGYTHLTGFLNQLPEVFDSSGTLIYDKRNKVRTFDVKGVTLVVKRYKYPLFHQRVAYTYFRPSKAKRAFVYGERLKELGLDTPESIAYIEEFSHGLFTYGYYVSAYCGDPDCRVIREEPEGHDALIQSLAAFLVKCHEKGFLHGDTNLSNFLYHKDSNACGGYHISTIDINRSHFVDSPTKEQCLKSLMRMTHVRDACRRIVAEYARQRGWEVEESVDYVFKTLSRFENRKKCKRLFRK